MAASTTLSSSITTFKLSPHQPRASSVFNPLPSVKLPSISFNNLFNPLISRCVPTPKSSTISPLRSAASSTTPEATTAATTFHGVCYVVGDNIDTDQIIPAEYLTLVPSNPDEYKKLGSYALCGLPSSYQTRFVEPGEFTSKFSIIIGGDNFGCGSSREHAPVALGAAGVAAVVAESYARIFFRNSVSTGEVYPLESEVRICEECKTGDVVTVELGENRLINHTTGKEYKLKPIGDAGPVIEAGGIFAYARKAGMISSREA
ncbi:Plasma membrane sulfite pump involved in sulfite metabolism [Datura stramonium]|uniref:Plasma membrane sulfite pump involved in sulfite metabolism n=1 Tax=Datura stramonium TaxID=4076 RepID=A0ABS8UYS0_DATST|nr:Plasma membrane sulfite pump involved in sulfite metabolism [Datura stramonium]